MIAVSYRRLTTLVPNATSKNHLVACSESTRGLQLCATQHDSYEVFPPGTDASCTDMGSHRAYYLTVFRKENNKVSWAYTSIKRLLLLICGSLSFDNTMIGDSSRHLFTRSVTPHINKDAIVTTRYPAPPRYAESGDTREDVVRALLAPDVSYSDLTGTGADFLTQRLKDIWCDSMPPWSIWGFLISLQNSLFPPIVGGVNPYS